MGSSRSTLEAATTMLRPRSFARYSAWSAARSSASRSVASSGAVATPIETVSRELTPGARLRIVDSVRKRIRSAIVSASAFDVPANSTANSSPP